MTLRDPSDPQWPEGGPAATKKAEALRQVDSYVDRLGRDWCRGEETRATVKEWGESYLKELEEDVGSDHNTYQNRRNHVRNHLVPGLGSDTELRTVGTEQVQELVDGLTRQDGGPAGKSLRDGVYTTLNNCWRYAFDERPLWMGKITLMKGTSNAEARARARDGVRHSMKDGYTPDELRRILIAAMAVDLLGERNPRKRRGFDNHADTLAFLIYFAVRVEESTFVRQKDVHRKLNAMCLPGTKTAASIERYAPIQKAYESWLDRVYAPSVPALHHMFPTSDPARTPSVDTVKGKVKRVLVAADLKRPGKLTHIFRKSHMSIALARGVSVEKVSVFAGQKVPKNKLISGHYLVRESFIASLEEQDFEYMPHLGSPEEIEAEARNALKAGELNV